MAKNNFEITHDLALLNVLQHMCNDYKGRILNAGQLYTLYQRYYDPAAFDDVVENAKPEPID